MFKSMKNVEDAFHQYAAKKGKKFPSLPFTSKKKAFEELYQGYYVKINLFHYTLEAQERGEINFQKNFSDFDEFIRFLYEFFERFGDDIN
jgi:hypothetical protein